MTGGCIHWLVIHIVKNNNVQSALFTSVNIQRPTWYRKRSPTHFNFLNRFNLHASNTQCQKQQNNVQIRLFTFVIIQRPTCYREISPTQFS